MITDEFKLTGKVAIVTGAGKGIGQSIGIAFAEAGANVVFAARTEKDIETGVKEAKKFGVKAMAVTCDVKDDSQLQSLVEKTIAAFGKIDILVNNAGGAWPDEIAKITRQQLLEDFDFNAGSAFSLTRMCLPQLRESRGCVINISSAAGRLVSPYNINYGTAKAALTFMTREMAAELAPEVRVNAIAPGTILTDSIRGFFDKAALDKMNVSIPMKRVGQGRDIALAALFLASPASSWITGKILEVDGGAEGMRMPGPKGK